MRGTSAYDRSGAGNTGTLTNGPAITEGKIGQGLSFDGVNDYVTISHTSSLEAQFPMTVTAWVKRDQMNEQDTVFMKRGGTNDGWAFLVSSSNEVQLTFFSVADRTSTATITDTNWHHVAATVSVGGSITFYIDGVPGSGGSFAAPPTGTSVNLLIGASADTGGAITAYADLLVDEARYYNRALTDAEIKSLYNSSR
jgi:hypothetical protein